jgi:tellurite resistance protein
MDPHQVGGVWLLREMWDFPAGVPEDERLDYLKAIMVCARAKGSLTEGEKNWVIGYGAACGAHQETVDALEAYEADEDIEEILRRNMPSAETWGRVAIFDAIRAAAADHEYSDDEMKAIRRLGRRIGVTEQVVADIEALYREEAALKRERINLVFGEQVPYQNRGLR